MKKTASVLFIALALLVLASFSVSALTTYVDAGGDKERGEEGEGDTVQKCLNFDGCPYGTENP